jgi:hypothetical protein
MNRKNERVRKTHRDLSNPSIAVRAENENTFPICNGENIAIGSNWADAYSKKTVTPYE